MFKRWITSYLQNNDDTLPSNWTAELSAEIFDESMIMESLKTNNINETPALTGKSITSVAQTKHHHHIAT